MAAKKQSDTYVSKAVTTSISATSRIALKVRDNYYTVEAHEERSVNGDEINLEKEWKFLWDSVNDSVDIQAEEIYRNLQNKG